MREGGREGGRRHRWRTAWCGIDVVRAGTVRSQECAMTHPLNPSSPHPDDLSSLSSSPSPPLVPPQPFRAPARSGVSCSVSWAAPGLMIANPLISRDPSLLLLLPEEKNDPTLAPALALTPARLRDKRERGGVVCSVTGMVCGSCSSWCGCS